MRQLNHRMRRSPNGMSEFSQFSLVLYVLFLIVLLPLLNLATLFLAAAIQFLATNDFAAKAATQPDYASALNSMASEAFQFQSNTLAQFVRMVPAGGYTGCGNDLYVLATNIGSGGVISSPPDQPLAQSINTTTALYELQVKSVYSVEPLVSLAALPLLGNVPGLGQAVTLTFSASRPVEHPGGLQASASSSGGSAGVTPFSRVASSPGTTPPPTSVTWRTPNIFQQILNAGETVVAVNVFLVQGNNPNWTPAGVTIATGQKIWVDTQAVGVWNAYPVSGPDVDANGDIPIVIVPADTVPALTSNCLAGQVGTSGTPFLVGDFLYNYQLSGTGAFSMIMNDNYYGDNTGAQMVRVIVVQ